MKSSSILSVLSLALTVCAVPPFDPAGAKNVGNAQGAQFIGGQCLSDADCGSGCCANPTGICSGPDASTQSGKTGCGFGGGAAPAASSASGASTPASTPATGSSSTTPANGGPAFDPAGTKNVGNGQGTQFIGGQCLSAADCGSGCCAGPSGICSGPGAQTQNGKTGCGFVSNSSSDSAPAPAAPAAAGVTVVSSLTASAGGSGPTLPPSTVPANGGPSFDPAGEKNVGNAKGEQFIGGQCLSAADCGSGCCAGPSGICSGPGAQTQNGKTGCGFVSTKKLVKM